MGYLKGTNTTQGIRPKSVSFVGVIRFFRHLALTFPDCLIRLNGTYQACETSTSKGIATEWLMLDLNAIFHPVAGELHAPKPFIPSLMRPRAPPPPPPQAPEKVIWAKICERLEEIRAIIQPTRGIYFAIDGVAGLSKGSQQKKRRFKAASERKETPGITTWDSTKISCGTPFMEGLSKYLAVFMERQLGSNPSWDGLEIIFSNHRVKSEGEHKLIQYMREHPELSYTVVSPDADLIFLSSGLHNPRVWIFRENIFDDIEGDFFLLDVGRFRDCILTSINMSDEKDEAKRRNAVEDFIVYCFVIGNDFLAAVPSLNVAHDGIEALLHAYPRIVAAHGPLSERLPSGQYRLRQEGVTAFLHEMARDEEAMLIRNFRQNQSRVPDQLMRKHLSHSVIEGKFRAPGVPDRETALNMAGYKHDYYAGKMAGVEPRVVVHEYLRGMVFVTRYYLEGIPSWTWSYPFMYAPLFSDLAEHAETFDWECKFEPSTALSPLEQLVAILPGKSAYLLPEPLRVLSTSAESPLADMFPDDFEVDMEGKKQEYEGIILLPHIDPVRLRAAFRALEPQLSEEDRKRNRPGRVLIYRQEEEPESELGNP